MRELVLLRGGDFAGVFAQFWRNVVELEFRIDLYFGAARDGLFPLQCREGVLIERVAHLVGTAAQGNVVFFRTGEVKKRGTKTLFLQEPHVDLQSVFESE